MGDAVSGLCTHSLAGKESTKPFSQCWNILVGKWMLSWVGSMLEETLAMQVRNFTLHKVAETDSDVHSGHLCNVWFSGERLREANIYMFGS